MQVEITKDINLKISTHNSRFFKKGEIVEVSDAMPLERLERLVKLKVAKKAGSKAAAKKAEPVKEKKVVEPVKEDKANEKAAEKPAEKVEEKPVEEKTDLAAMNVKALLKYAKEKYSKVLNDTASAENLRKAIEKLGG